MKKFIKYFVIGFIALYVIGLVSNYFSPDKRRNRKWTKKDSLELLKEMEQYKITQKQYEKERNQKTQDSLDFITYGRFYKSKREKDPNYKPFW